MMLVFARSSRARCGKSKALDIAVSTPHFGSGQPLVDAIKPTRGTIRRRQCEDGVGAVVQGIIDFEHHSLADVAVAILRNSKTDSEYKLVTALENTKSIGNLIPVAKVTGVPHQLLRTQEAKSATRSLYLGALLQLQLLHLLQIRLASRKM